MEFVIYTIYCGYEVPSTVARELGCDCYDGSMEVRSSKAFLEWARKYKGEAYRIVKIPEEATDFRIQEYDGKESVIYVLNGKIYNA